MKSKHLLLTLLMALLVPWAAQAQTSLFSEDFEDGSMPTGWTTDGSGTWSVATGDYSSSTGAGNGTYNAKITHGTTGNATKLITPEIDLSSVASAELSFMHVQRSWSGDIDELRVYYRTSSDGEWTLIAGCEYTDAYATWTTEEGIALPNISSTYQIAFEYTDNYGYGVGVDYINIVPPASCPKPTGLAATLTPGNGTVATLSWTENGEATDWVLQYGTDSEFATYTEVTDGFVVDGSTITLELTGLTAETTYYARVKADCGGGDESEWSNTCEFTPTNAQFVTVNDGTTTNNFVPIYGYWADNQQRAEFIIPSSTLGALNGTLIKSMKFYANYSFTSTGTFQVYIKEVAEEVFSGTTYYTESDATTVYTGTVAVSSTDGMTITFAEEYEYSGGNLLIGFYKATGGNYSGSTCPFYGVSATGASLSHYGSNSATQRNFLPKTTFGYLPNPYPKPTIASTVSDSPTATTITWTAPATGTPTGYAYQLKLSTDTDWGTETTVGATVLTAELTTVAESDYDFRVRAIYGENYSGYATTSFTTPGYCMTPTNLVITNVTDSEATLSWQEEFGAGHWMLGYKTTDETEYTYVEVNRAVNYGSWTLEELTAQTTYDVVIYPVCDETKTLTGSFTTMCGVITIPATGWTENFDSYTTGVSTGTSAPTGYPDHTLPDCWNFLNISATSNTYPQVFLSSSSTYAVSGNCLFFKSSSTTPLYAILPAFSENISGLQLTFTYRNEGTGTYNGTFYVGYMTDPADASTFTSVQTCTQTTTKTELEVTFEDAPAGSYIAFKYEGGSSNNYYASIDDVTVGPIPTCLKPSAVTKSDVTNHSATLSWTNGAEGQTAWQIAYKAGATFDPTDAEALATATVIDVTANPYTFDKTLEAATTYYMYVRANCGDGDYSKWSKTVCSFTTLAAAPAPTGFAASNIGPNSADLTWTAPAGDFLSGYELYYVAATEAPEAPTTETEPTVTVTLEEEMPYTLEGLTAETQYYIWVRANHGTDGYSAWTALSGSYFTTTVDCPVPTDLNATTITHYSATIGWTGFSEDYTVQYRAPGHHEFIDADFETGAMPSGWTTEGPGSWTVGTGDYSTTTGAHGGTYNAKITHSTSGNETYLITPNLDLSGQSGLNINLWYVNRSWSGDIDGFGVYYRIDGGEWNEIFATTEAHSTWTELNEELPAGAYAANCQFGFKMTDAYGYGVGVDDITLGELVGGFDWQTADRNLETAQLNGLTAGTNYEVRIQGICSSTPTDWSEIYSFTTLADNVKVFVTEGDWNEAGNWMDGLTPTLTDNAQLQANATITGLATAGNITIASGKTLTIADGGQLQHNNSSTITATVKKNITGFGDATTNNGYVLLASPLSSAYVYATDETYNIRTGNYDLYQWNSTPTDGNDYKEWLNRGSSYTSSVSMSRGTGYLYASQDDREITFAGNIYGSGSSYSKAVSYTEPTTGTTDFSDWNLLGNPFVCNAYLVDAATNGNALAFYKMNADGNGFEATTGTAIAPMEGVFYQATEAGNVYFTREMSATSTQPGTLNISLAQVVATRGAKGSTDNAIIRFGEGNTLGKFSFNENSAKVYIPQNGKDYAVVNAGNVGEMPVNFKANENGSYTLSFSNSEVTFSYLHLIDNMTGADVDLLATPSYTFDARYTDYASRFRLVFATGSSVDGDNFGFVNASGNLSIFGIEGTATLQVIDVTGRILSSETFSGSYEKKLNAAPGVYMLRLINGNDVKVQKIVVR